MNTTINNWEEIGNKSPFTVPEGYFDKLPERVMANLPERTQAPRVISLWERVKPWAYMAAMFAGIYLMVNLFAGISHQGPKETAVEVVSPADTDDFYQYYEDEMADQLYNSELYLAVEE